MSYRLKSGESLPGGFQRIFREEIQAALKETRRAPQKRGQAVHEFRKHLKKLRAALALVSDEVGKNRHAKEDRCVRQIGKLVADLRDAYVRFQTVVQLREKFGGRGFEKVFQHTEELLALELASFTAASAGWEKQAVRNLKALMKRIACWELEDLRWKQIRGAVAGSYRRGCSGLRDVLDDPTPKNLHGWRREIKTLWYQLRLLTPLDRVVFEEIANEADMLGELLGQHHDFVFLLSRLDMERADKSLRDERTKLEKAVRRRTRKLERDATELGRRFYAESPKSFAKRVSIFTRHW
jgi:CHAD domain-containing protein